MSNKNSTNNSEVVIINQVDQPDCTAFIVERDSKQYLVLATINSYTIEDVKLHVTADNLVAIVKGPSGLLVAVVNLYADIVIKLHSHRKGFEI